MKRSSIKKRVAVCGKVAVVALQLGTLAACQGNSEVSANRRRMDSVMANRDTAQVRIAREQDSMIAIMDGKAPGNLGAPAPGTKTTTPTASGTGDVTPSANKQTSPPTAPRSSPATDTSAAPAISAKGAAGAPPGASLATDQPTKAPLNTHENSPANQRARTMGDSIANARADRMLGITSGRAAGGDTIRGIVEMQGRPPAARAALRVDNGHKIVALTGLAGEGLSNIVGADVMVRGIKVSALDVVVSSYIVRAMQGAPALDGKLRSNAGVWSLELSDKSGIKRLSAVPSDLQIAENARVWIVFAPGTSTPKQYGVIATR
ncbi:MAG: hypothetical protein ABJC26_02840 [Gemmatimonadaceae bacterium]